MHSRFWWGNLKEKGHLENTSLDGRIILKWTLKQNMTRGIEPDLAGTV